jgi:xylulokinase
VAGNIIAAIDLGTTSCRAELFAADGSSMGRHSVEYPVLTPAPGAAEQDANAWWDAVCACLRATLREAGVSGADVTAVGLSTQGHSWVPTDGSFRPLRNALTWLDQRAAGHARELLDQYRADFWGTIAGKTPGPWHLLPQLLWLRETEPDIAGRANHLLMAHDFILAKLTDRSMTDYTTAAASLFFDIAHLEWDQTLLHAFQIDPAVLPEAVASGTPVGYLTERAAEDTGLSATTIAVTGAQDQKCAAYGAGLAEGIATASLGTATALEALLDSPAFDPDMPIPCFPYLAEGQWVLEAAITTTGGAVNWLRDALRPIYSALSHEQLTELAQSAPPGSNGVVFFPFIAGAGTPHWRFDAHGAFACLSLAATAADIARAVFEGCAFEIASALDAMRQTGSRIEKLYAFGGGVKSPLWTQIIAAVAGIEVYACSEAETALRGAAMLAAEATGNAGPSDVARFRSQATPLTAHPGLVETYRPLTDRYRRARDTYWTFDATLRTEDSR